MSVTSLLFPFCYPGTSNPDHTVLELIDQQHDEKAIHQIQLISKINQIIIQEIKRLSNKKRTLKNSLQILGGKQNKATFEAPVKSHSIKDRKKITLEENIKRKIATVQKKIEKKQVLLQKLKTLLHESQYHMHLLTNPNPQNEEVKEMENEEILGHNVNLLSSFNTKTIYKALKKIKDSKNQVQFCTLVHNTKNKNLPQNFFLFFKKNKDKTTIELPTIDNYQRKKEHLVKEIEDAAKNYSAKNFFRKHYNANKIANKIIMMLKTFLECQFNSSRNFSLITYETISYLLQEIATKTKERQPNINFNTLEDALFNEIQCKQGNFANFLHKTLLNKKPAKEYFDLMHLNNLVLLKKRLPEINKLFNNVKRRRIQNLNWHCLTNPKYQLNNQLMTHSFLYLCEREKLIPHPINKMILLLLKINNMFKNLKPKSKIKTYTKDEYVDSNDTKKCLSNMDYCVSVLNNTTSIQECIEKAKADLKDFLNQYWAVIAKYLYLIAGDDTGLKEKINKAYEQKSIRLLEEIIIQKETGEVTTFDTSIQKSEEESEEEENEGEEDDDKITIEQEHGKLLQQQFENIGEKLFPKDEKTRFFYEIVAILRKSYDMLNNELRVDFYVKQKHRIIMIHTETGGLKTLIYKLWIEKMCIFLEKRRENKKEFPTNRIETIVGKHEFVKKTYTSYQNGSNMQIAQTSYDDITGTIFSQLYPKAALDSYDEEKHRKEHEEFSGNFDEWHKKVTGKLEQLTTQFDIARKKQNDLEQLFQKECVITNHAIDQKNRKLKIKKIEEEEEEDVITTGDNNQRTNWQTRPQYSKKITTLHNNLEQQKAKCVNLKQQIKIKEETINRQLEVYEKRERYYKGKDSITARQFININFPGKRKNLLRLRLYIIQINREIKKNAPAPFYHLNNNELKVFLKCLPPEQVETCIQNLTPDVLNRLGTKIIVFAQIPRFGSQYLYLILKKVLDTNATLCIAQITKRKEQLQKETAEIRIPIEIDLVACASIDQFFKNPRITIQKFFKCFIDKNLTEMNRINENISGTITKEIASAIAINSFNRTILTKQIIKLFHFAYVIFDNSSSKTEHSWKNFFPHHVNNIFGIFSNRSYQKLQYTMPITQDLLIQEVMLEIERTERKFQIFFKRVMQNTFGEIKIIKKSLLTNQKQFQIPTSILIEGGLDIFMESSSELSIIDAISNAKIELDGEEKLTKTILEQLTSEKYTMPEKSSFQKLRWIEQVLPNIAFEKYAKHQLDCINTSIVFPTDVEIKPSGREIHTPKMLNENGFVEISHYQITTKDTAQILQNLKALVQILENLQKENYQEQINTATQKTRELFFNLLVYFQKTLPLRPNSKELINIQNDKNRTEETTLSTHILNLFEKDSNDIKSVADFLINYYNQKLGQIKKPITDIIRLGKEARQQNKNDTLIQNFIQLETCHQIINEKFTWAITIGTSSKGGYSTFIQQQIEGLFPSVLDCINMLFNAFKIDHTPCQEVKETYETIVKTMASNKKFKSIFEQKNDKNNQSLKDKLEHIIIKKFEVKAKEQNKTKDKKTTKKEKKAQTNKKPKKE